MTAILRGVEVGGKRCYFTKCLLLGLPVESPSLKNGLRSFSSIFRLAHSLPFCSGANDRALKRDRTISPLTAYVLTEKCISKRNCKLKIERVWACGHKTCLLWINVKLIYKADNSKSP